MLFKQVIGFGVSGNFAGSLPLPAFSAGAKIISMYSESAGTGRTIAAMVLPRVFHNLTQ